MKKALFGLALLLFAVTAARGQGPTAASIGLYLDQYRSTVDYWNPGGLQEITLYAYCRASERGMIAVEFAVQYPTNIIAGGITSGPYVTAVLGNPADGITLAFQGCEGEWTLAFTQTIYVKDTAASRIEIVPHPETNAIRLANCLEGNPVEDASVLSAICLNSSCGPDTFPPIIIGAAATGTNAVRVTFNEPVSQSTAEDTGNYEISFGGDPVTFLQVASAQLEPGGRSVLIGTLDNLVNRMQYTLRVHGIQDTVGNTILAGSEVTFIGFDTDPPRLVTVTVSSDSVVTANFNEAVTAASAEDPLHFWAVVFGTTSPRYYPREAQRTIESSVTLSFTGGLPSPRNYTLYATEIRDLVGNVIGSENNAGFGVPHRRPPLLVSVTVTSRTQMDVHFDERLETSSSQVPGNYLAVLKADTSAAVPVQTAKLLSDLKTVRLTFTGNLAVDAPYALVVKGVKDFYGNVIVEGSAIDFICADIYPPALLSARGVSPEAIDLFFDERLNVASAELTAHYSVFETAHTSVAIPVVGAGLRPDGTEVRLTLGGSLPYGISYTVSVAGIEDRKGNVLFSAAATVILPDTIPPAIASAELVDASTARVTFTEKVTRRSAEDRSNYRIFGTADTADVIPAALAVLSSDQKVVTLDLGKAFVSGRYYTLSVSGVSDLRGNVIQPDSRFAFPSPFIDTEPPRLQQVSAIGGSLVAVLFSELLDPQTATMASNYALFESADTLHTVPVQAASLAADSATVELSLADTLSWGVTYALRVSNVADRASNPIAPGSIKRFVAGGGSPLVWTSVATVDFTNIVLTFSAAVDRGTAQDTAHYRLSCFYCPDITPAIASATRLADGRSVLLRLASPMSAWKSYYLTVQGVEDLFGGVVSPAEKSFEVSPLPERGAVGLFADGTRSRNEVYQTSGEITEFTMYVWSYAGQAGQTGAEFAIRYPSNVIQGLVETNDDLVIFAEGDLASGTRVTFSSCNFDWAWTHKQTCYLVNSESSTIGIVKRPGAPAILFTECAEDDPVEQADVITHLYCNCSYHVGTLLKSFSACYRNECVEVTWVLSQIDEGTELLIARAAGDGTDFESLPSGAIERSGLSFTYRDRGVEHGAAYRYRIGYRDASGIHTLFETGPVAIPPLPLSLDRNWPNPFNPSTTIRYYLPEARDVILEIYDVAGRRIAILVDGHEAKGPHSVSWDGKDASGNEAASGIYVYRLRAGRETLSRKMVLLR